MKYDFGKIERKWQKVWREERLYEPDFKKAKKPFYNLMMFPYPSAEGLHVGNMYAFTGSDIYGRFKRMQGYDVFEPIGLDGFGIHSENYALKIKKHPADQAKISQKNFYKQLTMIGNGFAWEEKLETYDPNYYRWTQWIFIQFFKNGLAYRKKAPVNWCPDCKTVLADEQVINERCERCQSNVIKKELEQWFFKITKYADRLLKNIDKIDWSERVKIAQRNWIGRSEGAMIKFPISNSQFSIEVFTTRPDTLFGATYIVLGPEHELISNLKSQISNFKEIEKYIQKSKNKSEKERIVEGKEKTGVELKGIKAINPANQEEIPIWIADYVLGHVGTGAIMAVPAHDERDWEFAKKFNLPIRQVISPNKQTKKLHEVYEGEGYLINSDKFNGISSEKGKWVITKFVGGKKEIQYRLRDWLISRQRYWGPPIPLVFCPTCAKASAGKENAGWITVPEKDLPVKLPFIKDFQPKGKGESPLASVKSFYETKCPQCNGKARRETDVSDTFLDSAWYYLRYIDVKNTRQPFDKLRAGKWLPVNMYIGGAEHSVLHLLYSRFLAMAFHDLKIIDFEEPFTTFRAHGLLIKEGAKMSKSKGNIVSPDEYIKNFGADALRMYLMFLAPFEQGGDFRDAGIVGITRFLEKVWNYFDDKIFSPEVFGPLDTKTNPKIERILHQTIKKVTEDIEKLKYNTAISQIMILFNALSEEKLGKQKGAKEITQHFISKEDTLTIIKLLAPFAPHITEELWHQLGNKRSIHKEKWPEYDSKLIQEESFTLVVQVNGKLRDQIKAAKGLTQKKAEELAFNSNRIKKYLDGKIPRKIIYIPDRLINIVI